MRPRACYTGINFGARTISALVSMWLGAWYAECRAHYATLGTQHIRVYEEGCRRGETQSEAATPTWRLKDSWGYGVRGTVLDEARIRRGRPAVIALFRTMSLSLSLSLS